MTGALLKFFTVNKEGSKVVRIEKQGTEQDADIAIRRRSYTNPYTNPEPALSEQSQSMEERFRSGFQSFS